MCRPGENGQYCSICPHRSICLQICEPVEEILPSMEAGRIDREDLPRLWHGRLVTHALLDNIDILTERQQLVVNMYYRECLLQKEIAERLHISQQGVNEALQRAKAAVGRKLKHYFTFLPADPAPAPSDGP